MPPAQPPHIIPFPGSRQCGFILTNNDHACLTGVIGPCHGTRLEHLLATAPTVPGGRRTDGTDDDLYQLLEAIGIEIHGYRKIENERAGKPRRSPEPGGTVARLLAIHDKLEDYLS